MVENGKLHPREEQPALPWMPGRSQLRLWLHVQPVTNHGTEIPQVSRRCRCADAGEQDPIQEGAGEANGVSKGHIASAGGGAMHPKPHRSSAANGIPIQGGSGR